MSSQAHVFLSYARADSAAAAELGDFLRGKGVNVFVDNVLEAGESWQAKIVAQLEQATKVVVFWSQASVRSQFVLDEAHRGLDAGKLLQVLLPGTAEVDMPLPFRDIQSLRLNGRQDFEQIYEQVSGAAAPNRPTAAPPLFRARPASQAAAPAKTLGYGQRRRAKRTSVFIAHASNDKPRLSGPISVLVEAGFKVWIDRPEELDVDAVILKKIGGERIHYGEDWRERISRAIQKADLVLGCWSTDAIRGRREQFYYEIYLGLVQRKLVQCRVDRVPYDEIGMPYTFSHIADLSTFSQDSYSRPLDQLMEDLDARPGARWSWLWQ